MRSRGLGLHPRFCLLCCPVLFSGAIPCSLGWCFLAVKRVEKLEGLKRQTGACASCDCSKEAMRWWPTRYEKNGSVGCWRQKTKATQISILFDITSADVGYELCRTFSRGCQSRSQAALSLFFLSLLIWRFFFI